MGPSFLGDDQLWAGLRPGSSTRLDVRLLPPSSASMYGLLTLCMCLAHWEGWKGKRGSRAVIVGRSLSCLGTRGSATWE